MSEQQAPGAAPTEQAAGGQPAGPSPRQPRKPRGRQTVGDMVRSLAIVLVLVFVVLALNLRLNGGEKVHRFDYSGVLQQARQSAPYDVLAPIGLPGSWTPTSGRTGRSGNAVTWHLGFVTPAGDYAGVEQSNGDPQALVDSVAADGTAAGAVTLRGLRWRKLDGGHPETRALVLDGQTVTTVVAGGASWAELRRLAEALPTR